MQVPLKCSFRGNMWCSFFMYIQQPLLLKCCCLLSDILQTDSENRTQNSDQVILRHTETWTVNPRYNRSGYSRQYPVVYTCEFLEMLRLWEGFVVRELFKIKKKERLCNQVMCSMFVAWIAHVTCGILPWIPLRSVLADIGNNLHTLPPPPPISPL
jgi:hypothetical protein